MFDGDKLVCERVYFDQTTMLRQLGVARDPLSLTGRLQTWSVTRWRSAGGSSGGSAGR